MYSHDYWRTSRMPRWEEMSPDTGPELIDDVTNEYSESQFEWEIDDFFSHTDPSQEVMYESSDFLIGVNKCILRLHRLANSDVWTLFVVNQGKRGEGKFDYFDYRSKSNGASSIECGFKKVDQSLEEFPVQKIGNEANKEEKECFINHWTNSELLKRMHELTTTDSLTFTCTLKVKYNNLLQKSDEASYTKLTRLDTLSENFRSLLTKKDSCDVIFHVQDAEFNVHKAILIARSPVFAAMFEHDMSEKQTGIINIADCDPCSFKKFLEYLYCGVLVLEKLPFQSVLHLYCISNKYDVQELRSFCVEYMERNLSEDNVCDVIMLAEMNGEERLWSVALEFFHENAAKVVNTPKWESMLKNNPNIINKIIMEMASKIKA